MLTDKLLRRLYEQASAGRWSLPMQSFSAALQASIEAKGIDSRGIERYAAALHLEDLALACACAEGHETAWDHFVREQRPHLYRAADALDPTGGARELADALYADLYGLAERDGKRRSLFRYFHGRSTLTTWLRAVLSQRYVDRTRSARRLSPLPDEDADPIAAPVSNADPDRARYAALMQRALSYALERLPARDRLRLGCYYAQELTLAETGRALREHEATVSRQLARTRRAIREDVEAHLRAEGHLGSDEVAFCFASTAEDAGPLDLAGMLGDLSSSSTAEREARKISEPERSIGRESL